MPWWSSNYYDNKKSIGERLESADVAASRRREKAAAEGAARERDRRRRQWMRDVAEAQAEVIKLEAIPEPKRNARKLRQAKKRLRDLKSSHG